MSSVRDFFLPVRLNRQKFTASASQTVVTLTSISIPASDPTRVLVSINGREQPEDAYDVDSSTQITLSEAMEGGEIISVTVPSLG